MRMDPLLTALQKPTLWEKMERPFWDDEHISKGMLDAHLNPEWDAASRRPETIQITVKWLAQTLPSGCSILDLGCGPGLYTVRLAELGYQVTGLDFSRRSIAYAQEHDAKTKYFYQDYLNMEYHDAFDAITLIYCDYAALVPEDRKRLLQKVRKALKPGGVFIFDVFTQANNPAPKESTSWYVEKEGGFWSEKPHLCAEGRYVYENGSVTAALSVVITEQDVARYIIWDTAYTKGSLLRELDAAGFDAKGLYGDTCGMPYTEEAKLLCAVTQPR